MPDPCRQVATGLSSARAGAPAGTHQLAVPRAAACRAPPLELVRSAVTARSALEASDLERLETLGDAFLKFAVGLGAPPAACTCAGAPAVCAACRAYASTCFCVCADPAAARLFQAGWPASAASNCDAC